MRIKFDTYTVALLKLRSDAPHLTEEEGNALQDAHLDHLAKLHEAGFLLASGPVPGPADRELRGISILRVDPETALKLKQEDPAVKAGRFRVEVYAWTLPADLIAFSPGRMPHSMAEATGD